MGRPIALQPGRVASRAVGGDRAMAQDDGEMFIVPKAFFELNQKLEDRTGSD
jgi:hypothetical protein